MAKKKKKTESMTENELKQQIAELQGQLDSAQGEKQEDPTTLEAPQADEQKEASEIKEFTVADVGSVADATICNLLLALLQRQQMLVDEIKKLQK